MNRRARFLAFPPDRRSFHGIYSIDQDSGFENLRRFHALLPSSERPEDYAALCLCRSFMTGRGFCFLLSPSGEGIEGGFAVV